MLGRALLRKRVLRGEDAKARGTGKGTRELRDKDAATMVKGSVKAFENTLRGEVEFIEQDPLPALKC